MTRDLPSGFEKSMQHWLGSEWPNFRDALALPPLRALRLHRVTAYENTAERGLNTVLASQAAPLPLPEPIRALLGDPVAWMPDAFYIDNDTAAGRSVYHECGAYYLQEPSAMAVAAAVNPQPGETVLDLCAAPGGKTTALSRWMNGTGTLVANEIHPARVVVLAQNIERLGVPALILNESPDRLAAALPALFDRVLVDAPCSGEGMFRKDPDSRGAWTPDAPEFCAARQREILVHAARLVKPGGTLVYSTCTFNPLENEQVVAWALANLPLELQELPQWPGWDCARPEWADGQEALLQARRLWPHRGRGEGHFVASFRVLRNDARTPSPVGGKSPGAAVRHKEWSAFLTELAEGPIPEVWLHPRQQGSVLFAESPLPWSHLAKLKVLRTGIGLAHIERGRLQPHHNLATALGCRAAAHPLAVDQGSASAYLAGQTLPASSHPGWVWVHLDGLPLGWGKAVPGRVNNLYPKGLRKANLI